MSTAIIVNPAAGKGRAAKIAQQIQAGLPASGDIEFVYTRLRSQTAALAYRASRRHAVVAALGGDGTVGEVLEGIYGTRSTLGILPAGTGNDYARGLGIPRHPQQALDVLLQGFTTTMDVGVERNRVFGNLAAIGLTADIMEYVSKSGRLVKGPLAIAASVIYNLWRYKPHRVSLLVDGKAHILPVATILVMNMAYGGGGMQFAPEARHNDGHFSILVIQASPKLDLLRQLPKVYRGQHLQHPAVQLLHGRSVQIDGERLAKVFDGDLKGTTPLKATIHPQAVPVVVPQAAAEALQPLESPLTRRAVGKDAQPPKSS